MVVLKGTLVFCFGPKYWFKTEDLAQAEQNVLRSEKKRRFLCTKFLKGKSLEPSFLTGKSPVPNLLR